MHPALAGARPRSASRGRGSRGSWPGRSAAWIPGRSTCSGGRGAGAGRGRGRRCAGRTWSRRRAGGRRRSTRGSSRSRGRPAAPEEGAVELAPDPLAAPHELGDRGRVARVEAGPHRAQPVEVRGGLDDRPVGEGGVARRLDREEGHVFVGVLAGRREELPDEVGEGEDRRPGVEDVVAEDAAAHLPAGPLVLLEERDPPAGGGEADRGGQPAEAGPDDDRCAARRVVTRAARRGPGRPSRSARARARRGQDRPTDARHEAGERHDASRSAPT